MARPERLLESWLRQLKTTDPDAYWAIWRTVHAIVEGKKARAA